MFVALALIPCVVLFIMMYKKDKVEKEPIGLMIKLLFFGVLSVIPALLLEIVPEVVILLIEELFLFGLMGQVFLTFVRCLCVGFAEEFSKYWLLKLGSWNNKNFTHRFDAVLYASVVALGFAGLENILYVCGNAFEAFDLGMTTAIMRALLSVPGHMMFGVHMGMYYGDAKKFEVIGDRDAMKKSLWKAIWVPALLHTLFNFCLMISSELPIVLLFYFGYIIYLYYVSFKKINRTSQNDFLIVPAPGSEDGYMNNSNYASSSYETSYGHGVNSGTSTSTELPAAFAAVMGTSASKTKPSPASSPVTSQVKEAEDPDLEPQPAKPKFCTNCGNRLDPSMKFCGFCGSRVE